MDTPTIVLNAQLTPDLFWLTLVTLLTGLLWLPYILQRILRQGLMKTLGNPGDGGPPPAAWENRAQRAHTNAVENLVVFAPLVLIATFAGLANPTTAVAAQVYFWARLAHYIVLSAGVPVVRTLLFFVGFGAQVTVALVILGVI